MANCDICGKKLGRFDSVSYHARRDNQSYFVTICGDCSEALGNIELGDSAAYADIEKTISTSTNKAAKAFYDAWIIGVKENLEKKAAKEKADQEKKAAEERARWEQELRDREQRAQEYADQVARLKQAGADGYYEYKVVKLQDSNMTGCLDADLMMNTLNQMGLEGWRLVNAYSNEMGKNALALGGFGVNATADEHILIFERFQKI